MTGIILAGGDNRRMGTNKAFLPFGNERLIDRIVRVCKDIFQEVMIVTNAPIDYVDHDCTIITDIITGKGALGGIYTGLFYASHDHAFVVACDMPFLNKPFIEYMITRCTPVDIVVPKGPDGLQPLHAIYSRRCLPAIRRFIEQDQMNISNLYKGSKTLMITEDIFKPFDPEGKMFFNVNTQKDFELISSV
jgi:molybdopterin-guanine dinucleotide biosynthesis protein A